MDSQTDSPARPRSQSCNNTYVNLPFTGQGVRVEMNAASESALRPSAVNHQSLKRVAKWLKHHGSNKVRTTDPQRLLAGRYPQGLISDAEMQALMGVWH